MPNLMESSRMKVYNKLRDILGSDNVYFQPPETVKMSYPCFRYTRSSGNSNYANNETYHFTPQYEVTYISRDPAPSIITDVLEGFQMASYNRHFVIDNLYHDVFIIYK